MTRVIDGLMNVDFADREMPDWMVRVKEDYFKAGESFFKSPELGELVDDMDANGVERAILIANVRDLEGRAVRFARERPDRFSLAVGGFNLLKPMKALPAPSVPATMKVSWISGILVCALVKAVANLAV